MIRLSPAVLVAALAGLSLAPFPPHQASASCAGPQVGGQRTIVLTHRGEQTVRGENFVDGCADTESCSLGCGDCHVNDPESSSEDVELRITQMGRSWPLAIADADEDARIAWSFRLPAGVEPGKARLLAEGASPVVVTVR